MPIRPEWRKFYTAAAGWPAVRRRILERAGGRFDERGKYLGGARCERCGKPDREDVWTVTGLKWFNGEPRMLWSLATSQAVKNSVGQLDRLRPEDGTAWRARVIRVVLTVAHLNHTPGDDRDENLKALCQFCHLHWDRGQHRDTRSARKDAARPLLAEAAKEAPCSF